MKKVFKLLSTIIFSLLIVLVATSCNGETIAGSSSNGGTSASQNQGGTAINCDLISDMQTYVTVPSEDADVIVDEFTDGVCNYYYFKLGEIRYVPIYYSQIQKHNTQTHTLSIMSETSVSKILEKTTNICVSEAVEESVMSSIASSVGTSQDDPINACITSGISYSKTASFNSSIGVSFTESLEQSISNSTAEDLYLTSADAKGCYRYIKLATFDVYAVLVCDIENKTCYYDHITSVQEDSITASWYYSANEADMVIPNKLDSESKKLSFNASAIEGVDLYGTISDVRLLRKWVGYTDEDYSISFFQGTNQYIGGSLSKIYESSAPRELGLNKVKITVTATLDNPDGWSKCIGKILSPNETIYEKSENFTGNHTFIMTTSIDYGKFCELFLTDKNINASFKADGANWWDVADNHYYIRDCKITVEFVK